MARKKRAAASVGGPPPGLMSTAISTDAAHEGRDALPTWDEIQRRVAEKAASQVNAFLEKHQLEPMEASRANLGRILRSGFMPTMKDIDAAFMLFEPGTTTAKFLLKDSRVLGRDGRPLAIVAIPELLCLGAMDGREYWQAMTLLSHLGLVVSIENVGFKPYSSWGLLAADPASGIAGLRCG